MVSDGWRMLADDHALASSGKRREWETVRPKWKAVMWRGACAPSSYIIESPDEKRHTRSPERSKRGEWEWVSERDVGPRERDASNSRVGCFRGRG